MTDSQESFDQMLSALRERAKELNCLYAVEELLGDPKLDLPDIIHGIIEAIPPGWQYPDICLAKIEIDGEEYHSPGFTETPWYQTADIVAQDRTIGCISVYYTQQMPVADEGPFLKEEARLIKTIADRLGHHIHHNRMRLVYQEWEEAKRDGQGGKQGDWRIILDLLTQTDKNLYTRISHKMLNQLCWSGIREAEQLLQKSDLYRKTEAEELIGDSNRPYRKRSYSFPMELGAETFRIAADHLSDDEILSRIQKWMQEDKLGFLVRAVERNLSLPEIADAIRRYHHIASKEDELSKPSRAGVRVSLIRRFLSDQLTYISIAKEYLGIGDFYDLLQFMIFSAESHGRLGGKSAGLYLAYQILKNEAEREPDLGKIKTPKTWHITSDMQLNFMHYNNLDEIVEQKYKEISQVRFEYPHIVHTCKNSRFPPELTQGLSVALDDFGERPLIVRSSSVLEDRVGAAFSGKYKSLFLANQGTKKERLEALQDAIAEVYASMFGPDPIEYRSERGLLDFAEEMGIMIQEVVGTRIGKFFLPSFAGVAFSRNEFRWSPRIRREDGLIRLVPGLGTRAVDRLSDDYPIMFAPGQPGLRVNVSVDETLRYSPRWVDVINLETNTFETIEATELFSEYSEQIPGASQVVSVLSNDQVRRMSMADTDLNKNDLVVTFEGLMDNPQFVKQMHAILRTLEQKMGTPVDIEFAHDGKELYLLQCRPQSHSTDAAPVPIPKDLPEERVIFSANRFVSNGFVPDVTHIVYVDPAKYGELPSRELLRSVGRAVSKLNKVLPKRQFILMGPGRWGSRGDIKLGVNVTYSDINNTAMLIEIARKQGNYTPDLSFGTHFFQDLVEANIRYLPLYPDEEGNAFNEHFLTRSPSIFDDLLPEYAELADTVRVIDVTRVCEGQVLRVLMNADLDEAVAVLSRPSTETPVVMDPDSAVPLSTHTHWHWRLRMVEHLSKELDAERFGVKALYLFGSTKNATAGPGSDIDLLVHFNGTEEQRKSLEAWLQGWSLCLDEMNFLRTGYRSGGLLDVHFVTDEDIRTKTSYAVKIDAVTDPARKL
ncbi:pyruvate, phosphate dikinase, partial [candidate division GN15 bacterium]|nr:pyruvate, phosphate dikinase [candidate division GN15 bacterium]